MSHMADKFDPDITEHDVTLCASSDPESVLNMDCQWLDVQVRKDDPEHRKEAVIYMLRPQWRFTPILEEKQGTGGVNLMMVYSQESDVDKKDAIVLRIFGSCLGLDDRDVEVAAMQIAHHVGCFPKVLAIFSNGIAYQYAHGSNLTSAQMSDPTVLRTVARGLARLHYADLDSVSIINRKGEHFKCFDGKYTFLHRFRDRLDTCSDQLPDPEEEQRRQTELPPVSYLKDELQCLQTLVDELEFIHVPFCHADPHAENIVYDTKTDTVTFVDLELACGGPVSFDLMYVFSPYITPYLGMPHIGGQLEGELLRLWVKWYLEMKYELRGDDPLHLDERELQLMVLECKMMDVYMPLLFAIYGYLFLDSSNHVFPPFRQIVVGLKQYHKLKPSLQHLNDEYMKLKQLILK